MWKKILVQDTLERVVCIFLVSKFRIPKTLYLSDGEADNIQWYLNFSTSEIEKQRKKHHLKINRD